MLKSVLLDFDKSCLIMLGRCSILWCDQISHQREPIDGDDFRLFWEEPWSPSVRIVLMQGTGRSFAGALEIGLELGCFINPESGVIQAVRQMVTHQFVGIHTLLWL